MADSVVPADPQPGVLGRALGVIVSPGATFTAVARDPQPVGILFVACLVLSLAVGLPQLTERGRQAALEAQIQGIERFTGSAVTPEMMTQLEQQAQYGAYATIMSMFVFVPVMSMVIASVLWVAFNVLLGGAATFKAVLAVVTHSQVIGALGAVAAAPIQYVQGIQNMAGPFNFGVLLPMIDPDSFPALFLGSLSVFGLWQVVVTAIGLAVLYRRSVGPIAAGLGVAYILITALIVGALSSLTGGRP
jgi:hypothetical protein